MLGTRWNFGLIQQDNFRFSNLSCTLLFIGGVSPTLHPPLSSWSHGYSFLSSPPPPCHLPQLQIPVLPELLAVLFSKTACSSKAWPADASTECPPFVVLMLRLLACSPAACIFFPAASSAVQPALGLGGWRDSRRVSPGGRRSHSSRPTLPP